MPLLVQALGVIFVRSCYSMLPQDDASPGPEEDCHRSKRQDGVTVEAYRCVPKSPDSSILHSHPEGEGQDDTVLMGCNGSNPYLHPLASLSPIPRIESASSTGLTISLEGAMSDMLQAWYQSGYMTGRYQTLLELQQHSHARIHSQAESNVSCDPHPPHRNPP